MDIKSPEKRSKNMSAIKSADTKPEIRIRKALFNRGFRYRLHVKKLPGTPDIVLPKYNTVVFIHGCFWHGHSNCYLFKIPSTRTEFWIKKIQANIERDRKVISELLRSKWKVLIVWECSFRGKYKIGFDNTVDKIINFLKSDETFMEIKGTENERQ